MKTPAVAVALLAVLTTPCLAQRAPADLRTAIQQRTVAAAHADAATWDRLTTDDFMVVGGNGTMMTKAQRLAQIRASRPDSVRPFLHETVQMHGATSAVQRFENQGAWVLLAWTKDRGAWRVAAAQVTPIFPDSASTWHAIADANAKFAAGFTRGDVTTMAANYADDAVVMMDQAPALEGAAAIKQGFMQFLSEDSVPNVTLTTHDILLLPSTAIERGSFELTSHRKGSTGPGADTAVKGKYITVWQQQADGTWKIIRDISNSDNPPH